MKEYAKKRQELNKIIKESEPRWLAKEQRDAANTLEFLKRRNPSGKVSVGYGDFRNPLEKIVDNAAKTLKLDNLKQIALDAPKIAGKALQYAAPPIAAYDLFWNKPHESVEEIRKKGLVQDLSEIGLDVAALGAPAARMAGRAALGAGLDMAALPLGGYLAGKQVSEMMGGEPPKLDGDEYYTGDSLIFPPEQSEDAVLLQDAAAQMPNYPAIKKLLKNK